MQVSGGIIFAKADFESLSASRYFEYAEGPKRFGFFFQMEQRTFQEPALEV